MAKTISDDILRTLVESARELHPSYFIGGVSVRVIGTIWQVSFAYDLAEDDRLEYAMLKLCRKLYKKADPIMRTTIGKKLAEVRRMLDEEESAGEGKETPSAEPVTPAAPAPPTAPAVQVAPVDAMRPESVQMLVDQLMKEFREAKTFNDVCAVKQALYAHKSSIPPAQFEALVRLGRQRTKETASRG